VLARNKKFEALYKGESCYIFGNGASLKYYDFINFNDKIAIGCAGLFFHRDFKKINVKYYYEGHPFILYPYWINPYSNKINKNVLGMLYKRKMSDCSYVNYFISLSNYFGIRGDNIFYLYHFNKAFTSYTESKLDAEFTPMASSLSGMLGLALFMGFSDITLVGCDWFYFPQGEGHFYDFGRFDDLFIEDPINKEFLLDAAQYADIRIVTPHEGYRGHLLPDITYKELTGDEPTYKENYEIVSESDLKALSRCGMIYYKIFP
jgi:hypothetical protein